jgi:FkbM family methyltransferase
MDETVQWPHNAVKVKEKIKGRLRQFPVAYARLRKLYRLFVAEPVVESSLQRELRKVQDEIRRTLGNRTGPVFVVQVGANDGATNDPLHGFIVDHTNWRGIFIEPVEFVFERLKRNYGYSDRLVFENVAISHCREVRKFYYVSDAAKELGDSVSDWYDQLGSFDKGHILKHCTGRNSALQPYIVEQDVRCVPLQDVLDKHRVERIDLIHIDAEGFDFEVLSQLDFRRYKPAVVLYEHYHLPAEQKAKAKSLLEANGYTLTEFEEDTLARLHPSQA